MSLATSAETPRPIHSPNDQAVLGHWQPTAPDHIADWLARSRQQVHRLATDLDRRAQVLSRLAAHLREHREPLCASIIDEVGKLPAEACAELDYAESFITESLRLLHTYPLVNTPAADRCIRELAAGTALLITPYNDPVAGLMRKIGPAIAAGCPVVVKPSPHAVQTACAALAPVFEQDAADAGLVVLSDDPVLVQQLLAQPTVGVVSFTGSTTVGKIIAAHAGAQLVRPVLELGGNNPFLVLPSADLDHAVDDLMARKIRAAGQACSAVNRVYVHRDRMPAFRDRLYARVGAVLSGSARAPGVDMGPVRHREALERLRQLVDRAAAGGERVFAAAPARDAGAGEPFAWPLTVLEAEAGDPSVLDTEEAFGPLMSLRPYDSLEGWFDAAAQQPHALVAYLYGDPDELAPHQLQRLRFGSIGLNTTAIQSADLPTGGFGLSGYGREGGSYGLREFLAPINIRHRTHR